MTEKYDYVIFGAGIYGLFAATFLGKKGQKVALIEFDDKPLLRASYVNQARVHNGYHYPRSVSTAVKSAQYYERFNRDFEFAVNRKFKKIYAVSAHDSLTNGEQFLKFCRDVNIPAVEINPNLYFNSGMVDGAFETDEFTYDASIIREWYMEKVEHDPNIHTYYRHKLIEVERDDIQFSLLFENGLKLITSKVLNATYASLNQLIQKFAFDPFKIKYEMCEVILTKANPVLSNVGITVMDGPFFSVMPFGYSGYHSLTSVGHTPHETCHEKMPTFSCQQHIEECSSEYLENCNLCAARPKSAWTRMNQISKKYLSPNLSFEYSESLFSIKALMASSELDDSRPTVVRQLSTAPSFISVLSGKFNTIYDLEEVLV
jgi:hypothetical protein